MDLQLAGKVAIVTGASRGIGQAVAVRLAAEGMHLTLSARNVGRLRDLAAQIERGGGHALSHPTDLSVPSAPAALVTRAVEHFGHLDLVVNNAGATKRGDFLVLSEQDWADGFALKFYGAVRLCRAAWAHLIVSQGCIVNIAGVGGRTGSAEFTIGGAVNAALLNLTKCLADRGFHDGVRVNAVNPGAIATDRLTTRIQRLADEKGISPQEAAPELARDLRIRRFGQPEEVADAVAFLASARAAYLQGAVLDIDGGLTRTL